MFDCHQPIAADMAKLLLLNSDGEDRPVKFAGAEGESAMSLFSGITSSIASVGSSVVSAFADDPEVSGIASVIKGLSDTVSSSSSSSTASTVANPTIATTSGDATSGDSSSSFDSIFDSLIPSSQSSVSEEQLFSAVVGQRISASKGADAAAQYVSFLQTEEAQNTSGSGHIAYEHATKAALKDMRDSGALTSDETDQIYSQAFSASQLDSNTDALFDDVGGGADTTLATASRDSAISTATASLAAIDAGTTTAATRSVDEAEWSPSSATASGDSAEIGGNIDGQGNFLFKPISTHGTLVVLTPNMSVSSISLVDSSGNVVETSTDKGNLGGTRPFFRFKEPGGSYPMDLTVQLNLSDGSTKDYSIPDPSKRYD